MERARNELREYLNDDVIGLVIAYARYTEIEKLRIVLWKEPSELYPGGEQVLKTFDARELVHHIKNRFKRECSLVEMNIFNWIYDIESCIPCKEDEFSIRLESLGRAHTDCVLVTIEDLLPSKNLEAFAKYVPGSISEHFELIRSKYVSSIQKEMEEI